MLNNLKKRKKSLYLLILLLPLLNSCKKEVITPIDNVQPKPKDTIAVVVPIKYQLYKESYFNQSSGIAFTWHDVKNYFDYMPDLDNGLKGDIGGGQSYGDINGDGFQDILVSFNSQLKWFINAKDNKHYNSDTTYITQSTRGINAHKIIKTDVNNDGKADYIVFGVDEAVVGNYTGNFNVLIANTKGTFDVTTIDNSRRLWFHNGAAGDLNGDGNVDVITATYIWYGNGKGNFTNSEFSINKYTKAVLAYEILDMNGDGLNDIVLGTMDNDYEPNGHTTIIYNNKGSFTDSKVYNFEQEKEWKAIMDLELFDMNSDGKKDIIQLRQNNDGISKILVYIDSNGKYLLDDTYFDNPLDGGKAEGNMDSYGWSSFKFDDMDKDGVVDIVAENYSDSKTNGYKKINNKWVKYTFR
jgi:hypothetical protein